MGRGLVESARRVAQLDSLRGIAALPVVAPPAVALAVEPIPTPANDALAGPSTQQA